MSQRPERIEYVIALDVCRCAVSQMSQTVGLSHQALETSLRPRGMIELSHIPPSEAISLSITARHRQLDKQICSKEKFFLLAVSKELKVRPLLHRFPASLACEQVGWEPRLVPSPRKVEEADQRSMIKEYLKCVIVVNLHYNFIITTTILVIVTSFTVMLVLRLLIPMITVIT